MNTDLILTLSLACANVAAWLVLLPRLRRRWEAVGWLQRDEQVRRAEAARRDRLGRYVSIKEVRK